jgi:thioredoxin-related protein
MKTKTLALILTVAVATVAVSATMSNVNHGASRTSELPSAASNSGTSALHVGAKWLTDFPAARRLAQAEGKPMLLDFTGSDWCPWCVKLEREIFSTPEFQDYATKNLVLIKLDFPHRLELPPAQREQNEHLAKQFDVQGFPTLVVLNAKGGFLDSLGYIRGGPKPLLAKLAEVTQHKR